MATTAEPASAHRDGAARTRGGWPAMIAVIRHPHRGWRRIERAPASAGGLFATIALPLAAVGPVAVMIRDLTSGYRTMGIISYRPTPAGAIAAMLAGWAITLALVGLLAAALAALARRFGGSGDATDAVKVAVFGASAYLLAGIFLALPATGFLAIVGAYSIVLVAVGAPRLMRPADERSTGFAAAAVATAVALVVAQIAALTWVARQTVHPTVRSEGRRVIVTAAPSIEGAKLVAPATSKKNAPPPGSAAATAGVVPASSLQSLLPTTIEGFERTAVESQSSVTGGVASATANGTYVGGTDSFTLAITDSGRPGALATDNSVIAGETERRTDSGWQTSRVVHGVRISEKWSNDDHGGSYSRTVGSRFTVEARGTAPTIGTLRAAVATIDPNRLTALAP